MFFKLYLFKMCFNVFSKISHRFQSVFKIVCFKVFSKFLIAFNGFQMMCFKVFSKISHRFQWFSNYVFQSVFK